MRPLRARHLGALAAAGLLLAACASTPPPKRTSHTHPIQRPPPRTEVRPSSPTPPPRIHVGKLPLTALPGWADEDHAAALSAFQAGCGAARDEAMRGACQAARALGRADETSARAFFEEKFRGEAAGDGAEGVLTAYYAPEYEARAYPDAEFSAPVRPKPGAPVEVAAPPAADLSDPIDVVLARAEAPPPGERLDLTSADRTSIERASADGALAWMRAEDLFFLQIQGSGTLSFPDGRRMKAAYAADNGKPFVAIARPMVSQGLLGGSGASGDNIRGWLAAHRGREAQAVMQLNPRYVFFVLTPADGREPAGAAGIPLPAGRAIAVDPGRHAYGELFWIDASAPVLAGAARVYRRTVVALDTGAAIRGEVRADLYIGSGTAAGVEAGRVRHTLKMTRLIPVEHEANAAP